MSAFSQKTTRTADGLTLAYRDYDSAGDALTPVLCLAGLTRNARDFEDIAAHLAQTRRVICPDMRGRGASAWDENWKNYAIPVETGDVLALCRQLGLKQVVLIGTSRGGLIANMIAVMQPALLKGVVLNDVGPELDPRGLARIMAYVGQQNATPASWAEAMQGLRRVNGDTFDMGDADWMKMTRAIYRDEAGQPVLDHDPRIGDAIRASVSESVSVDPWAIFAAFQAMPMLVIRGEGSDILSRETVNRMAAQHPACSMAEIPKRGHAPFLNEPEAVRAIDSFLKTLDGA